MVGQSCSPFGIIASQTWEQVMAYLRAIEEYHVNLFVELGVHIGGLAAVLMARTKYVEDFFYVGVEIDQGRIDKRVLQAADIGGWQAMIQIDDCLSDKTKLWVRSKIHGPHAIAFVLCDGGNKPAEMEVYAPLIRPGDYIAAHDYPLEITDEDLKGMDDSAYFEQVDPQRWRYGLHVPLYRRVI